MLHLSPPFDQHWNDTDAFEQACKLKGKVFRQVESRRTIQFQFGEKSYFIKIHFGIGWTEVVKNLLQLRLPITSAENEWRAVHRLNELGIDTMTAAGFGSWGRNPANTKSFIITEDLIDTVSLEEYCANWKLSPPTLHFKRSLIAKLAIISKTMHGAGICHRDYYLCHFHLDLKENSDVKVSLIDLHRALIKKNLPIRWLVKDIAGLYFSAMDCGLTKRDLLRFMKVYSGLSVKQCLNQQSEFWRSVEKRASKLYAKH